MNAWEFTTQLTNLAWSGLSKKRISNNTKSYFIMKNIKNHLFLLLLFVGGYFAQAQDTDFAELGKRIATTCAGIKPGDVVVIYGGKHTIDLMEAIAIEAQKRRLQ